MRKQFNSYLEPRASERIETIEEILVQGTREAASEDDLTPLENAAERLEEIIDDAVAKDSDDEDEDEIPDPPMLRRSKRGGGMPMGYWCGSTRRGR